MNLEPSKRRRESVLLSPCGTHYIIRCTLPDGRKVPPIRLNPGVTKAQANWAASTIAEKVRRGELSLGDPIKVVLASDLAGDERRANMIVEVSRNREAARNALSVPAVYIFAYDGLLKVGTTSNLRNRMTHYLSHNPLAKLVAAQPCRSGEMAGRVESLWNHEARRLAREEDELDLDEWFLLNDSLVDWVNEKLSAWGEWWLDQSDSSLDRVESLIRRGEGS